MIASTYFFCLLHLWLQYLTSAQTVAHFLRQVKGRLQVMHIFWGRFSFFIFFKTEWVITIAY